MNYKSIIFVKNNGQLAGIGIQENGLKRSLTLEEAIRESAKLKKANKEDAIEFLDTRRKVETAKVQLFNEKPKKKIAFSLIPKRFVATSLAFLIAGTGIGYAIKTLEGKGKLMAANNKITETTYELASDDQTTVENANDFDTLLNASESPKQILYVNMMKDYINYFNIDFANTYKETIDGEVIKPALSWNYEIPALTIAYNNLSKKELLQIFNGVELDANTLDSNYKNATLQLFGAYVISDSSTPVKLYDLIASEEGKEFVKKYENMFYAIKDAKTEEAKLELITKFYEELYKDYPIDNEIREVGIAHSDARALMDNANYKLAITPMVAAMEVMYQNYSIDETLASKAIAYFNDLGMCNIAYEEFQKAEFVLEDATLDQRYADFGELSKIIIEELKSKDAYVIDDKHRDLSRLEKFQTIVNAHFDVDENGLFTGGYEFISGSTKTTTTVKRRKIAEWTETKTKTKKEKKETRTDDRDKAVKHAGEKKVKEAEDKVKNEIDKENQENEEKANKEADEKQKEAQKEEDKKAEEKKKEAEEANKQVQEDIQDINNKINENNKDNDKTNDTKINENDYHGIDFDDNHSDNKGNLDDSVKDVTTDSTGANKPLPNPEDTGKKFDSQAKSSSSSSETKSETKEETKTSAPAETKSEPVQEVKKEEPKKEQPAGLPDPNETGKEFDEKANNILSQEELIDLYIARMAKIGLQTPTKVKVLKR